MTGVDDVLGHEGVDAVLGGGVTGVDDVRIRSGQAADKVSTLLDHLLPGVNTCK